MHVELAHCCTGCTGRCLRAACERACLHRARLHCTALQVNSSPYKEGWIIKVKMSNKAELGKLLDSGAYQKECEKAH